MELTILMPCLNERQTLGLCIEQAQKFIDNNKLSAEILVADNGSTDGSQQLAQALGARVIYVLFKGYSNALRGGIEAARGKFIIMADCDMSYDFLHLEPFLEALRQGNDFVIGNRFIGGIKRGAMPLLHKYFGVPLLSWIGRRVYKVAVGDFHCGLRGVNRQAIMELKLETEGMEFATEMIGAFARSPYKIKVIPTVLNKDGRKGRSHIRTFRDGWRHLSLMLRAIRH